MNVDRLRVGGRQVASKTTRLLGTEWCFRAVIGLLVLQAGWLALSARYPMAFDEDFHFGLIKLHAAQWTPFFTSQPAHADIFGPVVRDPSYLYHYLMSFPYRIISLFTHDETIQIVMLRFLNIGLFAGGLIIFRQLLFRLGSSRALGHLVLLLFCLIPVVPFLAAHINYDNLFIPLVAWTLLATCVWIDHVRHRRLPLAGGVILVSVMLLASVVKYAFLPIFAAVLFMMAWTVWRNRHVWPALWRSLLDELERLSLLKSIALLAIAIIAGCLFLERYAPNLIIYHAPNPDCNKVLPIESCLQYGPWSRDYGYIQNRIDPGVGSVLSYPWQWLAGMWQRCFFAISDTYAVRPSLPIPSDLTIVLGVAGLLLLFRFGRRIFRRNSSRMVTAVVALTYIGILFATNLHGYITTGVAVAVNGRYLLPFLPVIFLFAAYGFRYLWIRRPTVKSLAALLVIVCFLQGGGAMTFIIRSDQSWDWPAPAVLYANNAARDLLRLFVVGAR